MDPVTTSARTRPSPVTWGNKDGRTRCDQKSVRDDSPSDSPNTVWSSADSMVTLPRIAPGLGAAAALVFLATVTELTATLLLAPIGTQTLATQFWANAASLSYGAAAPYAALMVAISALPTYLLTRRLGGVVQPADR